MLRHLFRYFLMSSGVFGALSLMGGYSWGKVVTAAIVLGLYIPFTIVSIATWRVARGKNPEDMSVVFGTEAPKIISTFHEVYQRHRGIVIGITALTLLGCGGLFGLWLRLQFPPVWHLNPGLMIALTVGVALCGGIAGPGLAIVGLTLLKGDTNP